MCPVPKIVNPINKKYFRPISILPVLSKVYEKAILYQLNDYIEKLFVYNSTQSGFRKGHSSHTLLLKFRDQFDTIDHESLVRKLASLNN